MIKVPCFNCKSREINCHSYCRKYKKYKILKDKENKIRRREADKYYVQRLYRN